MLSAVRSSLNLLRYQGNIKNLSFGSNVISKNYSSKKIDNDQTESTEINVNYLGEDHERIAIVEMNRPEAKNALNFSMIENLSQAIELLANDGISKVMILKSSVPGVFCAGADLKERAALTPEQFADYGPILRQLMIDIENLPMPAIAAIDGSALGGGLELSLACDFRTICNTAKVGLVETKWGIIPGAGGTQRLSRLINPAVAKELIYSAEVLDGEEAHLIGICNHCVQQNAGGDAAYQKALEIAVKITKNGPIAVRMAKLAINKGVEVDLSNGLLIEEACYAQTTMTDDRAEGLKAFAEKREAKFTGN